MIRPFLSTVFALAVAATSFAAEAVEITTPDFRGGVQPQIAVAPSGRVHVVFGKDGAVYHTASDDARVFTPPVKVGQLEKLALKMRRGPRVSATDKAILVTAISHADGNLHAWTSADGGKTFSEAAPINSVPKSAAEGLQAVAGDGKGKVAVVWLDNRTGAMQVWARFSTDGGVSWGEERTVYAAPEGPVCQCCHPSVAFSPSGEVVVMWRNSLSGARDMFLTSTSDFGRSFTPARKLGEGTWKLPACPMDGGAVAAGPDGKWHAVWRREGNLFSHVMDSPEQRFGEGRQPVIGFAGGKKIILWEQNGALMQQLDGKASRVAPAGSGPCIVSGSKAATIAWEAGPGGAGGLFLTQIPARP